jgi:MoxR-like ATPase
MTVEPPGGPTFAFPTAHAVTELLTSVGYIADKSISSRVHLAGHLGKPVLVEGPAGTGKTQLAKSLSAATGARLIRLQCYEGLDEAKALYEWDYRKQLLRIQAVRESSWDAVQEDIFAEEYLLTRPLLEAIRTDDDAILLIDEVDRLDIETEALLLEVLSDFQVSIPELGTVAARRRPFVLLTSNNSRELSEALKRRCLFLHIPYPSVEREREIVLAAVPGITEHLATEAARVVASLRGLDLKKRPSVSETLDWARTLLLLGLEELDRDTVVEHLPVLLKHQNDVELAERELAG